MRRKIVIAVTFFVLVFLGMSVVTVYSQQYKKNQKLENLKQQALQLEKDKEKIRQNIEKTKLDYEKKIRPIATEEFVFIEIKSKLYEEAFPVFYAYGIQGIIGLSTDELPDDNDCITMNQFKELRNNGWGTCALYNIESDNANDWYKLYASQLAEKNISIPKSVLILNKTYSKKLESSLLALGFENIIYYGDYDSDSLFEEPKSDSWIVGAYSWNFSGIRPDIQAFVSNGKNRAFIVSFFEKQNDYFSIYRFKNMLNYTSGYRNKGFLKSMDFESAADYRRSKAEENILLEAEREEVLTELENKKRKLQNQIDQIYSQWSL